MRRAEGSIVDARRGERLSAAALRREASRRAAVCAALGLGPGKRAALCRENGWELFADLFAVWEAGACAVVLDPGLPAPALAAALERCGAELVLTGRARPQGAPPSPVWLDPGAESARLPGERPRARPDDFALILYTSGSSGEPKGVVHTHRGLAARLGALRAQVGDRALRRTLCVLPACFGHGLIGNGLLPLLAGGELTILPAAGASALADLGRLIDDSRATFMSSVPAIWRAGLRLSRPPRRGTLERVHCASAPLSAELWRGMIEWTGGADVRNVYGATETASWIAGSALGQPPVDGLVGGGWGAELELRDGEVWVASASLMAGYDGRPDLTAERLRGGWYRTGDLGRIDAGGNLFLTGRTGETINRAGLKVEPQEVELALAAHPAVRDAFCFAALDEVAGQTVSAAIVLERPAERARVLAALDAWCRERLPAYKVPTRWLIVPSLPLGPRGKLNRAEAARSLAASGLQPPSLKTQIA